MQALSTLQSENGRGPEAGGPERQRRPQPPRTPEAEANALLSAALLLTAAGYRVEPMPPGEPVVVEALASPFPLTARERQVAELLVEGASNKVIARRLGISVHTAKFHVAAVLEKLGARNRSDAVAIALRDGLVAL